MKVRILPSPNVLHALPLSLLSSYTRLLFPLLTASNCLRPVPCCMARVPRLRAGAIFGLSFDRNLFHAILRSHNLHTAPSFVYSFFIPHKPLAQGLAAFSVALPPLQSTNRAVQPSTIVTMQTMTRPVTASLGIAAGYSGTRSSMRSPSRPLGALRHRSLITRAEDDVRPLYGNAIDFRREY